MSIRIAVRLPDALVRYVDEQVAAGRAGSRAALVSRALDREMRRDAALRDAAILAAVRDEEWFDGLAGYAASVDMPDLD